MDRTRLAVAAVALTVLAAACARDAASGGGGDPGSATEPFLAAANAAEAPLLPTNAYELPDIDLTAYEQLLGQLKGTPLVVNIWGSWCPPCRAEAPHFAEAHARYGDRVQFLGVDILDTRDGARAFMDEFGWTYPSLFDQSATVRDGLGYIGQPITIFYDADGEVVKDWSGNISRDLLFRYVERIAA